MPVSSAVPAPIRELVDIFGQHLGDVAFPGIDHPTLAEQAATLQARAETLAAAEAALEQAKAEYTTARDQLGDSADRAIAYARVYATDDEALSAKLSAIPLGRRSKRAAPPTKRRAKRPPPKVDQDNLTELPFAKKGTRASANTR